jgi:hypothetical protein
MSKIKFTLDSMNHTAKGYRLGEVYDTSERSESKKSPGKFAHTIKGIGLPDAGVREWEDSLFTCFQFSDKSPEYPMYKEFRAKHVVVQETPIVQPQAQVVAPVTQPVKEQPIVASAPIQEKTKESQKVDNDAVRGIIGNDILLAGLQKIDFASLQLTMMKLEGGKILISFVLDGMPPLSFTAGDISSEQIVNEVVETFSESAIIISSIRSWKEALNVEEAKQKANVAAAAKKNAEPKEPTAEKTKGGKKTTVAASITPEEMPMDEPDDLPDEPASDEPDDDFGGESNPDGLSDGVKTFEL